MNYAAPAPGEYAAAVAHEQLVRTVAYHDVIENIAGFPAVPLTLRLYSQLRLAGSPYLPPFRTPDVAETIVFLWAVSPGRAARPRRTIPASHLKKCRHLINPPRPIFRLEKWRRECFACDIAHAKIIHAAREYMDEAMLDRPPGGPATGPDYYCDECATVAALAREYHWSETAILDLPLKRLFQYLKAIREHHYLKAGQAPVLYNRSDDVVQRELVAINLNLQAARRN